MAFLWYSSGIFLVFYLMFIRFLLDFFAISRGFRLDSCAISMICLGYFYGIAWGLIYYVHGGSLLF